ncbi:hypothetical protein SLS62_008522 [Diatrype stigma]|uniref:Uncharacterized protein n=1 Tax=Diatrype stigma TaxID=117547 RepID=A0AAN9UKB6_9PEZI
MRRTLRLLANVKPTASAAARARYLEPGQPTGLTGIATHYSPRATLLLLYSRTLEQLRQQFPETSVYRQSVEALTKHRMAIVEAAEPPGLKEWQERASEILAQAAGRTSGPNADYFTEEASEARGRLGAGLDAVRLEAVGDGGQVFIRHDVPKPVDVRLQEWDGEKNEGPNMEGLRGEDERSEGYAAAFDRLPREASGEIEFEPEPQLTADQIEEIENKIGAGLIEEVINMAESELKLIDILHRAKVWEPLEEKPVEGQWTYFERNST